MLHLLTTLAWGERPCRDLDLAQTTLEQSRITARSGLRLNEDSRVDDQGDDMRLWFEGYMVPHFVIRSCGPGFGKRGVNWFFDMSPKVVVRMVDQTSNPVYSPSFMPGASFSLLVQDAEFAGDDFIEVLTVGYRHHSNGQDVGALDEGRIDHRYGDFSTDFLTLSIGAVSRRPTRAGLAPDAVLTLIEYEHHVTFMTHKDWMRSAGFNYGLSRLHLTYQFTYVEPWRRGPELEVKFRTRITTHIDVPSVPEPRAFDQQPGRLIAYASLQFRFPQYMQDFSIYTDVYYGQDYYNIWFDRKLAVARVGIAGDLSTPLQRGAD